MIIGVDPGLSGALALMTTDRRLLGVWDMPKEPRAKGKGNEVNAYLLSDLVADILDIVKEQGHKAEAIIEQVGPMPRDSRPAAFKFGDSCGVLRGVFGANYVPMRFVAPGIWKRHHSLIKKDKSASRMLVMSKWPEQRDLFRRVKDDGRAEAALIAEFGLAIAGWGIE
jgi:hypothetical protein